MNTVTNVTYALKILGEGLALEITETLEKLTVISALLLLLLIPIVSFVLVIWAVKTVWFLV